MSGARTYVPPPDRGYLRDAPVPLFIFDRDNVLLTTVELRSFIVTQISQDVLET